MSSFADKKIRIFRTKSQEDRVRIQRVRETGRLKVYNSEHDNRSWCPDQNLRRRHILELNRLRHFGLGNYIPIVNLIKILADIAGREKDEILNEAIESLDKVDQILDENNQLQQTADDLADLADCLNKAGGDLRKENECLRAEIERLKRLLAELQGGMKQTPEDDTSQKIPSVGGERPSQQLSGSKAESVELKVSELEVPTKPEDDSVSGSAGQRGKQGSLSELSPEELQKLASEGKLTPEQLQKLSSQGKLSPEELEKLGGSKGFLPPSGLSGLSQEQLAKLASEGKLSPEELAKLAAEGKLSPEELAKLSSHGLLPSSSLAGLSKEQLQKLASEGKLSVDQLKKLASEGKLPPDELIRLASEGKLPPDELIRLASEGKLPPDELIRLASEGKLPPDELIRLASEGKLSKDELARLASEGKLSPDELARLASEVKLSPDELAKLGIQPGSAAGSRFGPGATGPGATGPGAAGLGAGGLGAAGLGATRPGAGRSKEELARLASKDKHPSVEFQLPPKGTEQLSGIKEFPSEEEGAEADALREAAQADALREAALKDQPPGTSQDKGKKTEGEKEAGKQPQRPSKDRRPSAGEQRLRESEQALSACQDEMKQLLREMDCLRREIERLRRIECQLKEAEKKINNLQCEIETLQCLLHRQDKEANELVKIIETQQAEIDKLQSFEFKLREVCKQRDRLRCTVNSLIASQAEGDQLAKQKHAQEICILKKEIDRLRAVEVRMKEVEEERDELICKTQELQTILKSKDSELQQLCDQLNKQQECITSLQRLAASYEASIKPQKLNECCVVGSPEPATSPDNENLQAKMTELSDKVCQQATLILSQRKCLLEQHKYILEQEQIRNHMQKKIRDQSRKQAELMDERNILDNEIATLTNRLKSYLDKIQVLEQSIEQFLEDQGICGQSDQTGSNNCGQNSCCNSQIDQASQEQCVNETSFDEPCLHTNSDRSCMCKQSSISTELPDKLSNQMQLKQQQSRNVLNHNIYSGSAQPLNSSSSKLSRNESFALKKPCPNKVCSTQNTYTPQMGHIPEEESQPQQKGFMNQKTSEAQMYTSMQLDLEEKSVGMGKGFINPPSQTDHQNQLNASVLGEGSQSSHCQSRVCSSRHSNSTSNKVPSDVSETSSRRCNTRACSQLSGQNSFSAPLNAQQYNCEKQSSADNCCPETSFQNFCSEPTSDSCELISCQSSGGSLKAQYSSPCSESEEVSSISSTKTHCCPCSDNSNENNCKKCNVTSDLYRYDKGSRTDPCNAPINKLAGYEDDYIPPLVPPNRASQTPTGEMDSLQAGYCAMKEALPCKFKEKIITGTPRSLTNRRPRTDVPKLPHNRPMKRLMHSQTPQFKSIKTKGLLPDTCCCK